MISDNIIKTKFIVDTLMRNVDLFYKTELERFHQYLKPSTGSTLKSLNAPDYTIVASGEQFQVVANITKQLRFQDMGVRKLYTKPMFSILKHRVFFGMQYALTEEIKDKIRTELENSKP